ncbi:glycosyltransferase family 1 protein [Sphingobacterium sp. lm-10]|uniref:glycosyltransferase family 4 protein n=1 Tax=Sphingobacterium sp. lm-10 TaxID=2944904 RepID=UPI0020214E2C|nr:glycosyltransferase family 1 protein [Sphingobacterium sp. lm-10]MCL7989116.1 glycosyltransferase family 1 protein [Sphingobacterium sp. lm-10]
MIKVALFAEILIKDFDGAARTVFQLIDRIDSKEFSYLFVYGNGPEQFRHFESLKIPCLRLPVNDDYSFALPALTKQRLYAQLDQFSPDVIHITTPSALGFFALRYAQKRNIPVISIYHTHFLAYIPYYFKNLAFLVKPIVNWMSGAMLRFYNNCDKIYVPTPSMIQGLGKIGIEHNRLTLWQRGINLKLFNPAHSARNSLHKITKNTHKNILFASRLVWEKNLETLIGLANLIETYHLPYNVIIAGDGAAKKEMQRRMPHAYFLGKQDHESLATLYASADVFVFPSISETYGNVVTEAMASGLPCVIGDGGGSADLVSHGVDGYKCDPMQPEEYLRYINQLLNNDKLYDRVRSNALATVQQLDWDTLAHRYFEDVTLLAVGAGKKWIGKAS